MHIITTILKSRYASDGVSFIPTHVELTDDNYQSVSLVFNDETQLYTYYSKLIDDDYAVQSKNEFDLSTALCHAYRNLGIICD